MHKNFYISVLILLTLIQKGIGQDTLIIETSNYKPGIYRSFNEFKYNSPSIPFTYSIKENLRRYGKLNMGGKHIEYLLEIDQKEADSIFMKYDKIWGFSNGKDIFVCPAYYSEERIMQHTGFQKITYFGLFCYFEEVSVEFYSGAQTGYENVLKGKTIYLNTGEMFTLTKTVLKKILADDIPLSKEFRTISKESKYEQAKYQRIQNKQIIIKYNERNIGKIEP